MKTFFRTLLVAICLTWAGSATAYKPAVHKINGMEMAFNYQGEILFDGSTGRSIEPMLAGVALNEPAEPLSKRSGKITALKRSDNWHAVIIQLDYPYSRSAQRPSETYVVVYRNEGGIIDGTLAFVEDDIIYAPAPPYYTGELQFKPRESKVEFTDAGFNVTRNYEGFMGPRGGTQIDEKASVTYEYAIDENGKIDRTNARAHSVVTRSPNASVPGRTPDQLTPTTTESDNPQFLGMGTMVIDMISRPISDTKEPERLNAFITDQMAAFIPANGKARKPQFDERIYERTMSLISMWQKRFIYRNPDLWLTWLYNNQESNAMKAMAASFDNDEAFADFVTEQAKNIKDKKAKKWWVKMTK